MEFTAWLYVQSQWQMPKREAQDGQWWWHSVGHEKPRLWRCCGGVINILTENSRGALLGILTTSYDFRSVWFWGFPIQLTTAAGRGSWEKCKECSCWKPRWGDWDAGRSCSRSWNGAVLTAMAHSCLVMMPLPPVPEYPYTKLLQVPGAAPPGYVTYAPMQMQGIPGQQVGSVAGQAMQQPMVMYMPIPGSNNGHMVSMPMSAPMTQPPGQPPGPNQSSGMWYTNTTSMTCLVWCLIKPTVVDVPWCIVFM